MFDTLTQRLRTYGAYRNTYRELSRLSNRELNDIGLNRASIAEAARGRR